MDQHRKIHFVNRTKELSLLQHIIKDWNSRQVVFVQGEGGVGKTTLLREANFRMTGYLSRLGLATGIRQAVSRIGILVGISGTQWARSFLNGCNDAANIYNVSLIEADGKNDPDILAQEFERLLSQKVQAIIIDVGFGAKLQSIIKTALAQGVIVLSIASQLEVDDSIIQIDQDERGLASRCLDDLFSDINGQGEIAVCWNQHALPLIERRKELDRYLNKHHFVNLVAEIGRFTQPEAGIIELGSSRSIEEEVKRVLVEYPDLKAIWATTSEFTLTVLKELEHNQRSDILVYSIDFDDRIQAEMQKPNSCLKVVVGSDPAYIGSIMVRLAILAASGEKVDTKYFVPISKYTRSKTGDLYETRAIQNEETIMGKEDKFIQQEFGNSVLIDDGKGRRWLVIDFIDLDNIELRSTRDIQLMMIKQIGAKYFQDYKEKLELLHSQTDNQIVMKSNVLDETFLQCLDRILPAFRLVIFCDTTDALTLEQSKLVTDFLIKIADRTHNIAMFLSGRTAKELYNRSGTMHIVSKHLINLDPLDDNASKKYLQACLRDALTGLKTSDQEKILQLTGGIPMLIDLALDWLVRAKEVDWLSKLDLQVLKTMSPEQRLQLVGEFEKELVKPIVRISSPLDRLLVAMARVYPLDVELCAGLLDISLDDAERQISRARQYSFVKELPDGRIKLHDYMREMVWNHVDLDQERLIHDSERALNYYLRKIENLTHAIHASNGNQNFIDIEVLERIFWQMSIQAMEHYFIVDYERGSNYFNQLFTKATKEYRLDDRDKLYIIAQPYIDKNTKQINAFNSYEIQSRHVRHLIDRGIYDKARAICLGLIESTYLSPSEKMDMYSKLADCELQSGHLHASEKALDDALKISNQDENLKRWDGILLTTKGRVLSMQGKLEQAEDIYNNALVKVDHDPSQQANILHNMGYLASLQGDYEVAKSLFEKALLIRQERSDKRGIGASMISIGEIFRNKGDYSKAIEYYDEAFRIFEPQAEPIWLARIFAYRGAAYRLQGMYTLAFSDIQKSISLDVPIYKPYAFHLLGCIYWDQEKLDEAIRYFDESDALAEGCKDIRTMVNNAVGKAEIYYKQWADDAPKNEFLANKITLSEQRVKALCQEYSLPHHEGRMLFVMANLSFEQGMNDQALEQYAGAFIKLSTRIAGYGQTTFSKKLKIFENNLMLLGSRDKTVALEWCIYLQKKWSKSPNPSAQLKELAIQCNIYRSKISLL